jgi:hypothetical protein
MKTSFSHYRFFNLKTLGIIILGAFIVSIFFAATQAKPTYAAVEGWDAGRIIDDNVFTNQSSMSVSQIQNFLNSKVSTCDTWGTQPSEFGGGTRRQWAEARGYAPPYTCLKDYSSNVSSVNNICGGSNFSGGQKSAAQIIYDAAQACRINPQVLIVLLQKEQSLVTDTWPVGVQYRSATGYGCPDTAPCDAQYYGLANQILWSARMFRAIMDASPTWYTPYVVGNNYIQYNPTSSCGGSVVNIQNRATQALYNYTPYQPNQGALNSGWGTANCGAYGNRNFYLYFRDWFGSTRGNVYQWQGLSQEVYLNADFSNRLNLNDTGLTTLSAGQEAYIRIRAKNTGTGTWEGVRVGTARPNDRQSAFRADTWVSPSRTVTKQGVVGYGQEAVLEFKIKAPATPGNYREHFNLVIDGVSWLDDVGLYFPFRVVAPGKINVDTLSTLRSGESLENEALMLSSNSYFALAVEDNKVTHRIGAKSVWSSPQSEGKIRGLFNQTDGNLVLHDEAWNVVWASNTGGSGPSTLSFATDGSLILKRNSDNATIWTNGATAINSSAVINSFMGANDRLYPQQAIESTDRSYRLVLQGDGNLVLYYENKPVWATGTYNKPVKFLGMQSDGNLVLYGPNYTVLWSTKTSWPSGGTFYVQDDGNLVTYTGSQPVWASNTSGRR